MATIVKRGEGWQVRVRLKGQPPRSEAFSRLTDAKRWAQKIETEMRDNRNFPADEAKRHTLYKLLDHYDAEYLPRRRLSTAHTYRSISNKWKTLLGKYSLDALTGAKITTALRTIENESHAKGDKRGAATVNRHFAFLKMVLNIAKRDQQWLLRNPCENLRRRKEPAGRVRFLSDEERSALLTQCKASDNPDLYPLVVLALSTGMRRGELLSLTWEQVDLDRAMIVLGDAMRVKTGERRHVPLVGHALELLKVRSKAVHKAKVAALHDRRVFTAGALRTAWETALKEAGLVDFHFHDLRHTCASYLAMNGASAREIAEVLGHRTLSMAMRYSHLTAAHTSKIVAKMTKGLFK